MLRSWTGQVYAVLGLDPLTILYILGAAILGGVISWVVRDRRSSQDLSKLGEDWKERHAKAVAQNKELKSEIAKLQHSVEAAKKIVERHIIASNQSKTEIASLREKQNALQKNLFIVGAERDELKGKLTNQSSVQDAAKHRISELQSELDKNQQVYKVKLEAGAEERKILQRKIDDARSEQKSLNNLLSSARAEYQSVSNLLASAQAKLENMEAIENKAIALEADNAQLKHEASVAAQGVESLKHELGELTALKEQNKELVQCLKAMENRCTQYEEDARRYRNQYEKSEKESDTLRFKIGDIEKNFHEMRAAQDEEKKKSNSGNGKAKPSAAAPQAQASSAAHFGMPKPSGETDDLTQIIGIGKVFERTLHDMGIWYFRQIAAFGPAEIARINSELKEFKGRIEHDDWIGQAKELHFKKYGNQK